MSTAAVVILSAGLLVLLLLGLGALARAYARGSKSSISGMVEREAAMEAQLDVEEHDIEEMIAARNEIRKRAGRPPIGEELGRDALRDTDEA